MTARDFLEAAGASVILLGVALGALGTGYAAAWFYTELTAEQQEQLDNLTCAALPYALGNKPTCIFIPQE